jgi:gas vesicle protein
MKSRADLLSSVRRFSGMRRQMMAQNMIPKGNFFLVGLGVGSLIGILFAPKSGEETRKYLAKKASEGNKFARKQALGLWDRAEVAVERGKEAITQTKEQIATAIDVGRVAYNREKSKAHAR